jgi:hypothetical protein
MEIKSRRLKIGETCSKHGKIRNVIYKIIVGKPEGKKRPRGRTGSRSVDNIKVDL